MKIVIPCGGLYFQGARIAAHSFAMNSGYKPDTEDRIVFAQMGHVCSQCLSDMPDRLGDWKCELYDMRYDIACIPSIIQNDSSRPNVVGKLAVWSAPYLEGRILLLDADTCTIQPWDSRIWNIPWAGASSPRIGPHSNSHYPCYDIHPPINTGVLLGYSHSEKVGQPLFQNIIRHIKERPENKSKLSDERWFNHAIMDGVLSPCHVLPPTYNWTVRHQKQTEGNNLAQKYIRTLHLFTKRWLRLLNGRSIEHGWMGTKYHDCRQAAKVDLLVGKDCDCA